MAFIGPLKTTKSKQIKVLENCGYALSVLMVLFATFINFFPHPTPNIPVLPIKHRNIFSELHGRPWFVFGDSIVDAGNFNITTYPYGMDLESRETGRFTNGFTIADYLALKLHSPMARAYKRLGVGELQESGANFACGGCGILARTYGRPCTCLVDQISQLYNARPNPRVMSRAVYFVSAGVDDYIFNFQKEKPNSEEFADEIIYNLENYLTDLYFMGARFFIINNIGPLGCIPNLRLRHYSSEGCDEMLNKIVRSYNWKLEEALINFATKFENISVILADSYKMLTQIMCAPSMFGFQDISSPCCGDWVESLNKYHCKKKETDRSFCDHHVFLFFDGAHPTQQANKVFVDNCISDRVCRAIGI